MSDFASRLLHLPITNVETWDKINAMIKSNHGDFQPKGRVLNISHYIPGIDQWEFADISEAKQRAIAEIIRWQPLGGDHFADWLKNGEVKLANFNHPSSPAFIAAYLEIHWLCEMTQLSHSIHYSEYAHLWNWDIQSASKEEEFSGKSYTLSTACECVLEHLFKINKDQLLRERGMSETGTANKDEVTEKSNFVMGYGGGRVNLSAGINQRKPLYVVGIKDIAFAHRDSGWRDEKTVAMELVHVEADIDQLQYRLKFEGKDVGMVQFDFGHRTIEWEIEKRFIGTNVAYTAILSKTKS
jgi:hypothetical protein